MIATDTYLGPATILETGRSNAARVELPNGTSAWARLALAVPYQPVVGDEVLAITHDGETVYVIGLLRGSGRTTLRVQGDLSIEAPGGRIELKGQAIRLQGEQSVEAAAPDVKLRAGRLDILAHRIVEKARDIYVWVNELFQLKSRRLRAVTDSTMHWKAHRAYFKADTDVNIDGKNINLG